MTDRNERSPVPWKVSDVAIATGLVFVGFLITVGLLGAAIGFFGADDPSLVTIWAVGALEGLMLVAVWSVTVRKYGVRWNALGLRRPRARRSFLLPVLALLGSLVFTAIYTVVVTGLGAESLEPPEVPEDLLGQGLTRVANSLVLVLWGPFAEEVFFRGFILAALVPSMGILGAAAASSAVFAAAHISPGAMAPIFVTGLLLSWLYLRTGSIWPSFIAHALQNLIAVSVAS